MNNMQDLNDSRETSEYMNYHQLADWLGVARRTLKRWVQQRRIPSIKVCGKVIFNRNDIKRCLKKYTRKDVN
ncbi:MAG: helix-turn-helix domain-containing protein [Planctomycetota bacterium]|nr:helix-turn-helix domain-containing protein [Planctomycetota bacterium]